MGTVWETPYQAARYLRLLGEAATMLRPLQAQNKSIRVSWRPQGSASGCGCLGAGGGGCLSGDSQSAWTLHTKYLHGQDQPPLPRMGLGLRVTPVLPDPNEMSATKDGTQKGLSRNKGQVLAWDEGWGWAGQLITCNNCSGHPQAMRQLAPGTGSLSPLPWDTW